MNSKIQKIYNSPIKSTRSGSLFMAFSYPTKISPETIAVYILVHTKPGDTVLDVFGGSGTTGLAALLCDKPNKRLYELVKDSNIDVEYGPRTAYISEISGLGSFVSEVMTSKIDSKKFQNEAQKILRRVQKRAEDLYSVEDPNGNSGIIRHVIYTEFLICKYCNHETSFSDACVIENPINIQLSWKCSKCNSKNLNNDSKRVLEKVYDPILQTKREVRKRRPYKIYGQTGNFKWKRPAQENDKPKEEWINKADIKSIPLNKIEWGDLYRSGYHNGIDYIHDFYTIRNATVLSIFWDELKNFKGIYREALKLWILSYNSSHSTLMTRVVLKKNQSDFVLTGAQPGVLYISSLPVEKNIILGLQRKIKTFASAFEIVENSNSIVKTFWGSSSFLAIPDKTIDYVFTDPPFGDYIPYSELNFINEAWLNRITEKEEEAIISKSQEKNAIDYELLLTSVFNEVNRVLKDNSNASVVFHSASAKVWNALKSTFKNSNFEVINNSVLQKEQASFKQTNSKISVKGDAVLLLAKGQTRTNNQFTNVSNILTELVRLAKVENNPSELENKRLYSRYVGYCMSNGMEVELDAKDFYSQVSELIAE
ncbi:DNA methyltransferase [Leeuwenhoekiella sp. H156]|uniref:DNA methyltransferase n=1 Tax=Leeuwenhoekiella sp. H156 TaxID=3450128 RepID=UPI003FA49ADB